MKDPTRESKYWTCPKCSKRMLATSRRGHEKLDCTWQCERCGTTIPTHPGSKVRIRHQEGQRCILRAIEHALEQANFVRSRGLTQYIRKAKFTVVEAPIYPGLRVTAPFAPKVLVDAARAMFSKQGMRGKQIVEALQQRFTLEPQAFDLSRYKRALQEAERFYAMRELGG